MALSTNILKTGAGAIPYSSKDREYSVVGVFDFAVNNVTSGESESLFTVKAKQFLKNVFVEVLTPEVAADTIDIGLFGGQVDGFIDGANIGAAAGTMYHAGNGTNSQTYTIDEGGVMFATADTIDLKANATLTAAKIKVTLLLVDLS